MPYYLVNKNAQLGGEHEVHESNCPRLPDFLNRQDLGFHATCKGAVQAAEQYYDNVDGCYYCCNECHTR